MRINNIAKAENLDSCSYIFTNEVFTYNIEFVKSDLGEDLCCQNYENGMCVWYNKSGGIVELELINPRDMDEFDLVILSTKYDLLLNFDFYDQILKPKVAHLMGGILLYWGDLNGVTFFKQNNFSYIINCDVLVGLHVDL